MWTQCSFPPALLGSPVFHSACPAADTTKVLASPARCHTHPVHARELPQGEPAAATARSLKPIQPNSPPLTTALASAEERSVASEAPAFRAPQSAAESAQESPEGKAAKQKEEEAGATQPAGHAQLDAPASALNVPAGHGEQEGAPAALKVPAPQVPHAVTEDAPSEALALPAAHSTQASLLEEL